MEEIKVNDYIRTDKGEIAKVTSLFKGDLMGAGFQAASMNTEPYTYGNITKHSENILDLIEIGDILKIEDYGDISYIGWEKDTTVLSYKDMIEDIKTGKVKLLGIVTRQQFNSIKYEV